MVEHEPDTAAKRTTGHASVAEHWDDVYAGSPAIARGSRFDEDIHPAALVWFGDIRGRRLLDLGCGAGAASVYFARRGAEVTAVDVSSRGLEQLRAYCAEHGLGNVRPLQMSAFDVADLGPFDFVFGSMILHHLEPLSKFVDVLAATVPRGRAFFYENNARNPLLMWARRHLVGRFGIPRHGDREESPLAADEVALLTKRFEVEIAYHDLVLLRLLARYLLHGRGVRPVAAVDHLLFRIGPLRRFGYRQCLLLRQSDSPAVASESP